MNRTVWLGLLLVWVSTSTPVSANPFNRYKLNRVNRGLHGCIVDHTHNHGDDYRIWSDALCQQRDMYVYLPPGFDPNCRYPLILWLHGFAQDEQAFLNDVAPRLDKAIACGQIAPCIIASPDGSLNGNPCLVTAGSFFVNSDAGRFEDFIMHDVWNFLHEHYPIACGRENHILAGVSMGGGASCNLSIKYRDRIKACLCIFPPLNTRWEDCHGKYRGDFDPCCWSWKTDFSRRHEVVARFYGLFTIRLKTVVGPLYGFGPEVADRVSCENPAELLTRLDLKPCELAMYIAYGGKDQFNIDAQVESFLAIAKERGICPEVGYDPNGKHDRPTAYGLLPGVIDWLGRQVPPCLP